MIRSKRKLRVILIGGSSHVGKSTLAQSLALKLGMIQEFLERTYLYNERMMDAVNRLGLVSMDVEAISSLDKVCDTFLALLRKEL